MDETQNTVGDVTNVTTLPPEEKTKFLTKLKTFDFPKTKRALTIVGAVTAAVGVSKVASAVKNSSSSSDESSTSRDADAFDSTSETPLV